MRVVGIHRDKSLAVASLLKKGKKIFIEQCATYEEKEPFFPPNALTVSGLRAKEVFIRTLTLPLKKRWAIRAALPFQVESLFPIPSEEILLFPFFFSTSQEGTEIRLVASSKKSVQTHLQSWEKEKLDPEYISCVPIALQNTVEFFSPELSDYIVIYSDGETSSAILVRKKSIIASHSLSSHTKDLERTLFFFKEKYVSEPLGLLFLGDEKKIPFTPPSPFFLLENKIPKEFRRYVIPIGYGLDLLLKKEKAVQLRMDSLTSFSHSFRLLKKLALFGGMSLLLSLFLIVMSHFYFHKEREDMEVELQSLVEKPLDGTLEEKLIKAKTLSAEQELFNYTLNIPNVSDVFTWIASHPLLSQGSIEIHRFRYTLVNFPKIGKGKEAYQGLVEMEFTSSTPTAAREFHDALLKGDRIVNPKAKIGWETHKNNYQASFYVRACL